MKKLLVLCCALFLAACESGTEGPATLNNRIPGVGSTFVINSHEGEDSIITISVLGILPSHMGRDNVIQLNGPHDSPMFIDHESDGDVSLISGSIYDWVTIPVGSRSQIVHQPQRRDHSSGHNISEYTATPQGEQTLTIKGQAYTAIVTELRSVLKMYDQQEVLQDTRIWTEVFYWIPQIGFFGRSTYESGSDEDVYDLIDYTLM